MMSVLCIGEMLIDFTPVPGMKNSYTANPGGAPANVAVSLSRNGVKTGFLGKLGDDDFGKMLISVLRREGIEVLAPTLTPDATTTLAFVTLDETGDRSFTFARKPGADLLLNTQDVDAVNLSDWDYVHAGSVSLSAGPEREAVLYALKKAKELGKIVCFDINFRDKIWSAEECMTQVDKVFPYVDLLKISEEELLFVGGEANIESFMEEQKISVVVLTRGGEGARIYHAGKQRDIPSMKVGVLDTTGAGDAFWGGFLSSLQEQKLNDLKDLSMEKLNLAGEFATICGGLCVTKHGGIPSLPYHPKYRPDTEENKAFLEKNAKALLDFGKHFPSPGGSSYYLGDDGTPWTDRNRETWITSRMVHVYSIGAMMGYPNARELAAAGLAGLKEELKDKQNGGWYPGITPAGEYLADKQCYAHAFVILASSSAYLAGIDGAEELLNEALKVYEEKFWDDKEGLAYDTWNTDFTVLDDYRGINANMHTVEAFLAVADATGGEIYRERAGRIIDHIVAWAMENEYRIPEHFTKDWTPDLEKNADRPDDPFKPYGATPGHGIEWARLIVQWCTSSDLTDEQRKPYIDTACKLFERAVKDAWCADGAQGIVYTTDWRGCPVVHDRMHWTLAEAINTSAVLYRVTGKEEYAEDYAAFLRYLDTVVLDHQNGSWFHQLDENNRLKGTVWPGKSDVYHAFQAMLIPYRSVDTSIAATFVGEAEE